MSETPNFETILADIDARIARWQAARESLIAFMLRQGFLSPITPRTSSGVNVNGPEPGMNRATPDPEVDTPRP